MQQNFQYSEKQLDLLQDKDLIYRKNELLETIEKQLHRIAQQCNENYPQLKALSPPPKVSKGEKHEGLPFLVLDYPRQLKLKDHFAIRLVIWWGKQISLSLQLKGKYLAENLSSINASLQKQKEADCYLQFEGDEWAHELKAVYKNYTLPLPNSAAFLKISYALPIEKTNELSSFYQEKFHHLLAFTTYGQL